MNKSIKQKNQSKHERLKALSWLAKKFPEAFDNRQRIRPLKIGIIHDIMSYADEAQQAGISKTKLREAVVLFTRRVDYLTCLKLRETRIDLSGHPTERVSLDDAEKASLKIKKRIEKACQHIQTPVKPKAVVEVKHDARSTPTRPSPSIKVKRKFTAPLDPDVARKLREKLDLEDTSI